MHALGGAEPRERFVERCASCTLCSAVRRCGSGWPRVSAGRGRLPVMCAYRAWRLRARKRKPSLCGALACCEQLVAAAHHRRRVFLFRRAQQAQPAEHPADRDAAAQLRQRNREQQAGERRRQPREQRRRNAGTRRRRSGRRSRVRPMHCPGFAPCGSDGVPPLRIPPESRPVRICSTCCVCTSIMIGAYSADSSVSSNVLTVTPMTPPQPRANARCEEASAASRAPSA